jgi:hypothetical protein
VGGQNALADDTDADKDNSSIAGLMTGSYLTWNYLPGPLVMAIL